MSDLLNSLHEPAPEKSWAQEVADAGAAEPPQTAPEAVSADLAPEQPATQDAATDAPQAQEQTSEEPDRRVPLKALQEERQKRAEYERKLQEYERQMAEMQGYVAAVQQQMGHNGGPPLNEANAEPDPETDPIGALKFARDQLRQMQEVTAEQQYVQQLNTVAHQAATTYAQQVPDYRDAYQYALQSRAQELSALGTPDNMIPQILQREELTLVDTAVRNGRNPAEAIYQFAKARGFQVKQAAPVSQPTPPNPALQQAKQAVAASAAAGGAPAAKGELSVAEIANLKGAAFDQAWNKLFGGNKSSMFRE